MFKGKTPGQIAWMLLVIIFGNFLYALAVTAFVVPADLVTGGSTGIALAMNHMFGMSVSGFMLAANVLMLLVGFVFLGKAFAVTTLASTFLIPAFLEICERALAGLTLSADPFLCTVFGGLGIGIALGIVIRTGSSTGGMDIPPLVVAKYTRIPVSVGMYVLDILILFLQAIYSPLENFLYGVVLVIIYTVTIDKVLLFGTKRIEVKVISEHTQQIADAILHELDRGVTLLQAEGGYKREDKQVVLSIVSNRELSRLEKIVHRVDPECFMIVSHVSEVRGRGFSMDKMHQ